jgi:chaperone modulatory protein CbpM
MNTPHPTTEIVDDGAPLRFVEVLAYTRIERTYLVEMVEAGIVSPKTAPSDARVEEWQFTRGDLRRIRTAYRLISDLQVNLSGAALILDLIEEREALLKRLRLLSGLADD